MPGKDRRYPSIHASADRSISSLIAILPRHQVAMDSWRTAYVPPATGAKPVNEQRSVGWNNIKMLQNQTAIQIQAGQLVGMTGKRLQSRTAAQIQTS